MNRTGKDIKNIAYHCSAGYGNLDSMRRFWRSKGWRYDGYHLLVDIEGNIIEVVPMNLPSNGVLGHNFETINICYTGGVERSNVNKAFDSRSPAQKIALIKAGNLVLKWIDENGGDVTKVKVLGHRDFSPDKNKNGVIDNWERIKECPSFDAIPEYKNLVKDFLNKKGICLSSSVEYVVRSGDSLYKIASLNNVSMESIYRLNNLKSDVLQIGQRLKIK